MLLRPSSTTRSAALDCERSVLRALRVLRLNTVSLLYTPVTNGSALPPFRCTMLTTGAALITK
jgi:hypothetical protein